MKILAVDPGKRSLAWAWFDPALTDAGFESHRKDWIEELRPMLQRVGHALPGQPDLVVVEAPRLYPRDRRRPNDLLDLSVVVGACVVFGPLRTVTPREWKGQTPKDISAERTRAGLTPAEVNVLKRWNKNHHVFDAVGIGRWYVRKMSMR